MAYVSCTVDFKRKHTGCFSMVVCVVDGNAEVVGFCRGFGGLDVGGEGVVCCLPLEDLLLV